MLDRVLSLLNKPGMRAVIKASVDWASAFSRTDPTKTISKFIAMGLRSSIVNVLIDFLEDRHMSVKYNSEESSLYNLIGGGPQGSWTLPGSAFSLLAMTMLTLSAKRIGTSTVMV